MEMCNIYVQYILARSSARSFCDGCRTVLQDRALSQIACVWCRVKCEAKAKEGRGGGIHLLSSRG